jgi:methylenetetrahydrofolate reductase (NADPH)
MLDISTSGFSVEFFPPKTNNLDKLLTTIQYIIPFKPLFFDLTWGAGGSTADLTLNIAQLLSSKFNIPVNMHITCTNMPLNVLQNSLQTAKLSGINNIIALRGDKPTEKKEVEVEHTITNALELINYINSNFPSAFNISTSGYPEGHSDYSTSHSCTAPEYLYLKSKIDAGAKFIITQLFYDPSIFITFVQTCRHTYNIQCPIIPGIMLIQSYTGFHRMTKLCNTYVPPDILIEIEKYKDDPVALKQYGVKQATEMCQYLFNHNTKFFHFYSLNNYDVLIPVLENLVSLKIL